MWNRQIVRPPSTSCFLNYLACIMRQVSARGVLPNFDWIPQLPSFSPYRRTDELKWMVDVLSEWKSRIEGVQGVVQNIRQKQVSLQHRLRHHLCHYSCHLFQIAYHMSDERLDAHIAEIRAEQKANLLSSSEKTKSRLHTNCALCSLSHFLTTIQLSMHVEIHYKST